MAEDGAQGCCEWGLADLIGASGRSLVTGMGSSDAEFNGVMAQTASRASRACAACSFWCCFLANLPIVEIVRRWSSGRPSVYIYTE